MCSPPVFAFLKSPFEYFQADILLLDDEIKNSVSIYDENFKKLSRAKGFVKSSLAKKISLRRSPEIQFILDDGFFKEQRIEKILKQEEEELKEIKKDEK